MPDNTVRLNLNKSKFQRRIFSISDISPCGVSYLGTHPCLVLVFVVGTFMRSQHFPGPERFLTQTARKGHPLQIDKPARLSF